MHPNKCLIYKKYTPYVPVPGEHIAVEPRPFDTEAPPPPGGFTVKTSYLSLDPYMRGQMRGPDDDGTYSIPWVLDQPAKVLAIATVLKSDNPDFKAGDLVSCMADAAEFSAVTVDWLGFARSFTTLPLGVNIRLETLLSAFGIAGLSAYVSFVDFVPEPRKGKTMLVSAASGGVGQIVGQMGKIHGMKVIGSTSSQEKVDFVVNDLGYDGAWNYKEEKTTDALKRLAPEGVDVYYDNVGGEQLETVLRMINDFGTIIASGMITQYNLPFEEKYGIRSLQNIFFKRLTIYGFICKDARHQQASANFGKDMLTWIAEGKIKTREEVLVGIDNAPDALVRVWSDNKFGKMVLKINQN